MNIVGQNFLAGSVFAGDQDIGIRHSDPIQETDYLSHRGRSTERDRLLGRDRFTLGTWTLAPHRLLQALKEALIVPRLDDKVRSTTLQSLDGKIYIGIGSEENDGKIGIR